MERLADKTVEELKPIREDYVKKRISGLSAESKNKLFAIWMSKERLEESKTIDIMFALDEEWERVYQEYRIKEGFSAATLRANERLLTIVYGG